MPTLVQIQPGPHHNRPCSSVVEHTLGKGEVTSSILVTGFAVKPYCWEGFTNPRKDNCNRGLNLPEMAEFVADCGARLTACVNLLSLDLTESKTLCRRLERLVFLPRR